MSHGNFRQDNRVIPGGAQSKPKIGSLPPKGTSEQAPQGPPPPGTRTFFNVALYQTRIQTNSTLPQLIFQTESSRQSISIQNRSTDTIFIGVGQKANAGIGIEIPPGETWEPVIAPINAIFIVGNQVNGTQVVIATQGLV